MRAGIAARLDFHGENIARQADQWGAMTASNRRANGKKDWQALALRAAELGDLSTAKWAFVEALSGDPRSAALHHNLAVVEVQLGEIDAAARHLTTALRFNRGMEEAAR